MSAVEFCYWLQGKLEIDAAKHGDAGEYTEGLSASQVEVIKKHLALVFVHDIDPKAGGPEVQSKLNKIHGHTPAPCNKNTTMRC
jgi:hypothetical protein